MSIYDTLNKPQKEAVLCTEGPLLILAGAGSGKTRVLTHRIAYLIEELGVNPWNILAITFTNKAAGEMRQRVDNLVGFGSESIWVSTFHSMCVRILRRYIDRLGYDNRFTIYDTDDQKTLMKAVCKKVDIDTKQFKERMLLSVISSAKNEMVLPEEFELNAGGDFARLKIAKVYREYGCARILSGTVPLYHGGRVPGYEYRAVQTGEPAGGQVPESLRGGRRRPVHL